MLLMCSDLDILISGINRYWKIYKEILLLYLVIIFCRDHICQLLLEAFMNTDIYIVSRNFFLYLATSIADLDLLILLFN